MRVFRHTQESNEKYEKKTLCIEVNRYINASCFHPIATNQIVMNIFFLIYFPFFRFKRFVNTCKSIACMRYIFKFALDMIVTTRIPGAMKPLSEICIRMRKNMDFLPQAPISAILFGSGDVILRQVSWQVCSMNVGFKWLLAATKQWIISPMFDLSPIIILDYMYDERAYIHRESADNLLSRENSALNTEISFAFFNDFVRLVL